MPLYHIKQNEKLLIIVPKLTNETKKQIFWLLTHTKFSQFYFIKKTTEKKSHPNLFFCIIAATTNIPKRYNRGDELLQCANESTV